MWPVTPLADPVTDYVSSLQAFKYCRSRRLVLPSHGLPFSGIATRVQALETHHEDPHERALRRRRRKSKPQRI